MCNEDRQKYQESDAGLDKIEASVLIEAYGLGSDDIIVDNYQGLDEQWEEYKERRQQEES